MLDIFFLFYLKMKKTFTYSFLLALMAAAGCSDDGSSPDQKTSSKDWVCQADTDCTNGRICQNKQCILVLEPGGDCTIENSICKTGQCENGTCKNDSVTEPDCADDDTVCQNTCANDSDCKDDKICVEAKCNVPECIENSQCNDDKICEKGRCIPSQPIKTDDCQNDSDCDTPQMCNENHQCVQKNVKDEEECSENTPCPETSYCSSEKTCVSKKSVGEACDEDLECLEPAVCRGDCVIADQPVGEACSDYYLCASGLVCQNEHCTQTVNEDESCDEFHLCPISYRCFTYDSKGMCIIDRGTCTSDGDCNADSYCCTEESCQNQNVCVQYGIGPRKTQNTACMYKRVPGLFEADVQCEWLGNPSDGVKPDSDQVMSTILAVDLPFDSGNATELVMLTFSGFVDRNAIVLRIFNGETCELLQSIPVNNLIANTTLAAADLDNDGKIELVVPLIDGNIETFRWNDEEKNTSLTG